MKTRVNALLLGLALSLAGTSAGYAMSELVSISMEPEWPATSSPGNVITYRITAVTRAGQGLLEVNLTSAGLPEGTTVSFSPNPLRFTGRAPTTQTALMTIHCAELTATDLFPFTVTATSQRETITVANVVSPSNYRTAAAQPTLALDNQGDQGLRLRGTGSSGQSYRIESTSDLANPDWTSLGSCTADGNGRFTFLPEAGSAPMRFYRAVWLAPAEAAAPNN